MKPSDGNVCWCGSRLAYMDGLNSEQLDYEGYEDDREESDDTEECDQCDQPMSEHDDGECPKKYRED